MTWRFRILLLFSSLNLTLGCSQGRSARHYSKPSPKEVVDDLIRQREKAHSFRATTRMVYWEKGKRLKPTVLMMGEIGSKIRVNALNPDESTAGDLACDGVNFNYQDFNHNCQLQGPCNRQAVSQLLRINLTPDELLYLAMGAAPMIYHDSISIAWNSKHKSEILSLAQEGGLEKQRLELRRRGEGWDLLSATLLGADEKVEWKIENKDFHNITDAEGQVWSVPQRTRFSQPAQDSLVEVRWLEQTLNSDIDDALFSMQSAAGIPSCNEKSASAKSSNE